VSQFWTTDPDRLRFGSEPFYAAVGRAFVTMCAVIPVLFAIEALDYWLRLGLDVRGGIIPRSVYGLDGIVFSPLLHDGFGHLYANSVPLLLLGTFVMTAGWRRGIWSTAFIMLVGGLGVWLVGEPGTVVVGASGVIFGYFGLLLARGIVERSWWNLGVVALVALLYWSVLFGLLPGDPGVSWQGHLFGFVSGAVAAILFRR
jgi:membrane associated rhomboid family serine protease